jgi:hypothetical protein
MEIIWLLLRLTLSPDKESPRDLTGEITVTYHQRSDECRTQAIKSDQRFAEDLKARGIKDNYDETVKKAGIINMAICWNGTEAQMVYPKAIDSRSFAIVARFTPISYVDKRSGRRETVGTGISRATRFETISECRKGLANASTELERLLKPKEEKAVFCLSTS